MTTDTTPTLLTEVQSLTVPDAAAMDRSAKGARRMALTFVISCDEDYELAGEEVRSMKAKIDALEAKRMAVAGPLHKAWTAFNAMFKAPTDELRESQSILKNSMIAYASEKEHLAKVARQEAEKLAAAERKKIEDAAKEVERLAMVERQRIARVEAGRVAVAQAEQDRLVTEATAAAAAGNVEAAAEAERLANEAFERDQLAASQAQEQSEQVAEAAVTEVACLQMIAAVTSAPVVQIASARAAGTSISKTVDFGIADLHALVKHVAEHPELLNLLMVDSVKLRAYVRGLGMNTKLPGVNVFEKRTMSARAA